MLVVVDAYLDKQEEVRVLALGGGPLALLDVVFGDIDSLDGSKHSEQTFSTLCTTLSSPFLTLPAVLRGIGKVCEWVAFQLYSSSE